MHGIGLVLVVCDIGALQENTCREFWIYFVSNNSAQIKRDPVQPNWQMPKNDKSQKLANAENWQMPKINWQMPEIDKCRKLIDKCQKLTKAENWQMPKIGKSRKLAVVNLFIESDIYWGVKSIEY